MSAGHLSDENFTFRWLHLVSQFKFTMSNNLGGSLFYSIAAGIPHKLISIATNYKTNKNFQQNIKTERKSNSDRNQKLWRMFLTATDKITTEQTELVNYCLGGSFVKQPKTLLKLLLALK